MAAVQNAREDLVDLDGRKTQSIQAQIDNHPLGQVARQPWHASDQGDGEYGDCSAHKVFRWFRVVPRLGSEVNLTLANHQLNGEIIE